jgi:hypothetical protein
MGGRRVPGGAIGQRVPHDPLGVGKATSSSLTSPIRPAVARFSSGKSLSGKGERGPKQRKSAVVPTKSILTRWRGWYRYRARAFVLFRQNYRQLQGIADDGV